MVVCASPATEAVKSCPIKSGAGGSGTQDLRAFRGEGSLEGKSGDILLFSGDVAGSSPPNPGIRSPRPGIALSCFPKNTGGSPGSARGKG